MKEDQTHLIVGDVHGCIEELEALLEWANPGPEQKIIFLGDLVSRGPDSHGVVERVRQLDNATSLLGNHELRLLHYRQTHDQSLLKAYDPKTLNQLNKTDWEFMETQMMGPIQLEQYDVLLAHGGFLPSLPWQQQDLETTTRIQVIGPDGKAYKRNECANGLPWEEHWTEPPFVIYGHTPREDVKWTSYTLGIDTGCVLGGHLSACMLPSKEIIKIPAKRTHYS